MNIDIVRFMLHDNFGAETGNSVAGRWRWQPMKMCARAGAPGVCGPTTKWQRLSPLCVCRCACALPLTVSFWPQKKSRPCLCATSRPFGRATQAPPTERRPIGARRVLISLRCHWFQLFPWPRYGRASCLAACRAERAALGRWSLLGAVVTCFVVCLLCHRQSLNVNLNFWSQ